jgi:superfamily II DNA or RNA helicase
VVVVGTLASISGQRFESVLADGGFPERSLLIVDEVHNAGAPTYCRTLREGFGWRLGLSATPTRHFDEEGTAMLRSYFGSTVYSYDMRRALADGHLCPYRYYVYPAHLNVDEYEEYMLLTRRLIQLRGEGTADLSVRTDNRMDGDSAAIDQLLFRRARILKKCESKISALQEALDEHSMRRGLIYCADTDQLTNVCSVLERRQQVFLTYTAATPSESRRAALTALGSGHVPILVAIDCLDEGVDVPTVDQAIILASSSNKRQFIQRRGRILRRAPGKTIATLVDVVAIPPVTAGQEAKHMLGGELARAKEMAELASNKYDVLRRLKACTEQYGVYLTQLLSGEGNG